MANGNIVKLNKLYVHMYFATLCSILSFSLQCTEMTLCGHFAGSFDRSCVCVCFPSIVFATKQTFWCTHRFKFAKVQLGMPRNVACCRVVCYKRWHDNGAHVSVSRVCMGLSVRLKPKKWPNCLQCDGYGVPFARLLSAQSRSRVHCFWTPTSVMHATPKYTRKFKGSHGSQLHSRST